MLRKFGFRRRSVLIQWRAQGVIQVSGGKTGKADKFTYPVRIGGKQVRMMKIVALDSVEKKQGFEERVKGERRGITTFCDNHLESFEPRVTRG